MEFVGADPVLAVHNLDEAAEWFRLVLGCRITEPDPGNWTFCVAGPVTFRLGRCPDALPAAELGDHSYLAYLTVDCVDDYYRRALSAHAQVIKAPTTEPWGRREMGLRSPEGHRFMLSEPVHDTWGER